MNHQDVWQMQLAAKNSELAGLLDRANDLLETIIHGGYVDSVNPRLWQEWADEARELLPRERAT